MDDQIEMKKKVLDEIVHEYQENWKDSYLNNLGFLDKMNIGRSKDLRERYKAGKIDLKEIDLDFLKIQLGIIQKVIKKQSGKSENTQNETSGEGEIDGLEVAKSVGKGILGALGSAAKWYAESQAKLATERWQCTLCGQVRAGNAKGGTCPRHVGYNGSHLFHKWVRIE